MAMPLQLEFAERGYYSIRFKWWLRHEGDRRFIWAALFSHKPDYSRGKTQDLTPYPSAGGCMAGQNRLQGGVMLRSHTCPDVLL